MTKKPVSQFRNIVFTINNYTKEDIDKLDSLPISYRVIGYEIGESGTPHIQGYAEFDRRVSFGKIKELIPRMHFERRKGTQKEAVEYCKKDGSFAEAGTRRAQGDRTDIQNLKLHFEGGGTYRSMFENPDITLNYGSIRLADKLTRYYDKPRDFKPEVTWLYGKTGVGKTRTAYETLPEAYFCSNSTGKWWSGYDGHEDVILDDIRESTISFITLLGLLDRYPFQVEDKGCVRQFRGRRIIITSHRHPSLLYTDYSEDMDQLLRRIDIIKEIK